MIRPRFLKEGNEMKRNAYTTYKNPHKDVLDTVHVGDLVKCNDWKSPLRVLAVGKKFFVMGRKMFGKFCYSVCHKEDANFWHNRIKQGMPYIGLDSWVFGKYDYETEYDEALQDFENGEVEVSHRSGVALYQISIKTSQ